MLTHRAGPRAVLLECADAAEVAAWHAELVRRRDAGELSATDLVPAARTVLVDGLADPDALAESLAGQRVPPAVGPSGADPVEITCVYDGPDLADVADLWGTSVEVVVARHTGTAFRVAFCGFSPGFGYLTGLPPDLAVPRLPSPRPRVAAGSVGLAGEYSGVYPSASPGGWRLIGRTDAVLFDPDASPPALLAPGTSVRFRAVAG
ncbi:MAG TPA: allophanate hydrolase subunit 1 [Actinocatenispora sp.]